MQAEKLLKLLPFWEHLSSAEKDGLILNTVPVTFEKGTEIHNADMNCRGVLFIKSGGLRTYLLSEGGREVTLFRSSPGEVCILSASCVLSAITFDVHIEAEMDSDAYLISSSYFQTLSEQNIHVKCFAYQSTTERFSDVMWTIQQILFMSMDRRLAVFLWDEFSKNNTETLELTHEQTARYIGSAREVVSRMLKYFAEEGVVTLSRGGIKILDKSKLRSLAMS